MAVDQGMKKPPVTSMTGTGDERGLVRDEKRNCGSHVLTVAHPAGGCARDILPIDFGLVREGRRHGGLDASRRHAIDRYAVRTCLAGEHTREADQAGFRSRVAGAAEPGIHAARLRRHVDDTAPAAALHEPDRRARDEKCSCQIDRKGALPIRLRRLFHAHAAACDPRRDAGIVHGHIEAAEPTLDLLEHLHDLGSARNIAGKRVHVFAALAQRTYRVVHGIRATAVHQYGHSVCRQALRNRETDPLVRARDQSHPGVVFSIHAFLRRSLARLLNGR
jgi:hypothetical protein